MRGIVGTDLVTMFVQHGAYSASHLASAMKLAQQSSPEVSWGWRKALHCPLLFGKSTGHRHGAWMRAARPEYLEKF